MTYAGGGLRQCGLGRQANCVGWMACLWRGGGEGGVQHVSSASLTRASRSTHTHTRLRMLGVPCAGTRCVMPVQSALRAGVQGPCARCGICSKALSTLPHPAASLPHPLLPAEHLLLPLLLSQLVLHALVSLAQRHEARAGRRWARRRAQRAAAACAPALRPILPWTEPGRAARETHTSAGRATPG